MAAPESTPCDVKTCVSCGLEFERRENELAADFRHRKTCSRKCANAAVSATRTGRPKSLENVPGRICEVCGVLFYPAPGQCPAKFNRRLTCSNDCRYEQIRRKNVERGQLHEETTACEQCGAEFTHGRGATRLYCSQRCFWDSRAGRPRTEFLSKECAWCGQVFHRRTGETSRNFVRRKTCSYECSRRQQTRSKTAQFAPRLYPIEFEMLRERVLDRDGHQCRLCGSAGGDGVGTNKTLHVHHINYCKHDSMRMANLITLCRSCHARTNVDRDYWQRFFEAMMLSEELAATG